MTGKCASHEEFGDTLLVTVKDAFSQASPVSTWPMSQGYFKAMVLLCAGRNTITLEMRNNNATKATANLNVDYVPLLQLPPLHLAIMIAKDSPLVMDCPEYKAGGLTTAHSDLDAAIAKLRIAAYMWQALTAEDMRAKGLERRSFRLEEEYGIDTTRRTSFRYRLDRSKAMGTVPKIHIVRSDKTVAELLEPNVAQQNEQGRDRDALHRYFENALKVHGGVFNSASRPIVAGLILDSAFSIEQNLLLGHAALGCHKPDGTSLGVFGSHLMYSWPRFLDEIPSCLTDTTPPGDFVCNDNGECGTCWEAASIGQGAFLHEVGHAFGAPHTTGIMARGYAQDWPKSFIAETAYCAAKGTDGATVIPGVTSNDATWAMRDAMAFRCLPHFRLPGDPELTQEERHAFPSIRPLFSETDEADKIIIDCKVGLAQIEINNGTLHETWNYDPSLASPPIEPVTLDLQKFDRSEPLRIGALSKNGRANTIPNAWKLLHRKSSIRIQNSNIILQKQSVMRDSSDVDDNDTDMDDDDDDEDSEPDTRHHWTVLLREKGPSGVVSRANAVDLRVGCVFDGAVVYYEDGHSTPCGHRWDSRGRRHEFGGHASQKLDLPQDAEIVKVEVNKAGWGSRVLGGVRVTLSNGVVAGELNVRGSEEGMVEVLEVADGEKIVGFFGASEGYTVEFGIVTVAKGVELPEQAFDMLELQNVEERS